MTTQPSLLPPVVHRTPYPTSLVKALILAACLFFILVSALLIPYAGFEDDECLFAGPIYAPIPRENRARIVHRDVPLMIMPYVGAAKTWLYGPLLKISRPTVWTVRMPMILLGAATIWLLYRLLIRIAGARAALVACAILSTDTVFLLTTAFDWGPVAIQHLAVTAGILLCLAAWQDQSADPPPRAPRWLARISPDRSRFELGAGFFLFGLGMWDKALCMWMLSGLAAATAIVFFRELRRMLTRRNITLAVGMFALGALPLIIYNLRNPWATFRGNTEFSTEGFRGKAELVKATLGGSSLFGYIAREEWDGPPAPPRSAIERASVGLREWLGERRNGLEFWAFVAALAMAPLWRRRWRAVLFFLVAMIVAWLAMALNLKTGGGAHHTILLWPLPHIIIGIAFAEASRRIRRGGIALVGVAVMAVCLSNATVLNQYFSNLIRFGSGNVWTDAIFPLNESLSRHADANILIADWGMYDSLVMLSQGRLHLWVGSDAIMTPEPTAADLATLERELSVRKALFVGHTAGNDAFEKARDRLEARAKQLGYEKHVLEIIADRLGRQMFEIVEFRRGPMN